MVRVDGQDWELCSIMFAEDKALVADSEEILVKLKVEFGNLCVRKRKIDVVH